MVAERVAGASVAALAAQPCAEGEAVLSGVFVRGEVAVLDGVGACVVESGADGVGACGRGGAFAYRSVGCDAEGGQEILLAGVEMLPGLLLDTDPAVKASGVVRGRYAVGTRSLPCTGGGRPAATAGARPDSTTDRSWPGLWPGQRRGAPDGRAVVAKPATFPTGTR